MTDPRAWLDQVDAIHNQLIRNDERAEWQRLTAEHDALPAATTALRAVLDLHDKSGTRWEGFPRADRKVTYCVECQKASPCPTVTAITTALEGSAP